MPAKKWPEIDGLRALCATAVMFAHWGPIHWAATLDTGGFGVGCFFVISGFLITNILLDSRDQLVVEGKFWQAIKIFYARRALRIFPVYYATLIACAALVVLGRLRIDGLPWHFAYLSNVYVFVYQRWPRIIGPVWSLSVEEQFYLLWPAIVFLTPRGALRHVIVIAIALGFSFRLGLILDGFDLYTQTGTLLPSCVDSLGLGALLAVLMSNAPLDPRALTATAAVGIASYTAMILCSMKLGARLPYSFDHLSVGLIAFALLGLIASRRRPAGLAWLNWRPLRYMGTISYGIYLFHPLVQYAVDLVTGDLIHHRLPLWPRFAVCFTATVATASVSWFLLEKPFLSLKTRFRRPAAASPSETDTILEAA